VKRLAEGRGLEELPAHPAADGPRLAVVPELLRERRRRTELDQPLVVPSPHDARGHRARVELGDPLALAVHRLLDEPCDHAGA